MAFVKMKPPVGVTVGLGADGKLYYVDQRGFANVDSGSVSKLTSEGWTSVTDSPPGKSLDPVFAQVDPVTGMVKYSGPSLLLHQCSAVPLRLVSGGTLYACGDSQTYGYNAATRPYTSGGLLRANMRWPNILASTIGYSAPTNLAIGGSRISFRDTDEVSRKSHFNQLGWLPYNWSGAVVGMLGWNNLGGASGYTADYFTRLRNAYEAWIARALIDDWFAVTSYGWTRSSATTATPGFSATSASTQQSAVDDGNYVVFPSGTRGRRYYTQIASGGKVAFNADGVRAFAVFFDTKSGSGSAQVKVNGVVVTTLNLDFETPEGDSMPAVIWVDNVPDTVAVEVNALGGPVSFLAGGSVSKSLVTANRQVVLSGPNGNPGGASNYHPTERLIAASNAAEMAVGAFGADYQVSYVDTQSGWVTAVHQEPGDLSHLTDRANLMIATSFANPVRVLCSSSAFVRL